MFHKIVHKLDIVHCVVHWKLESLYWLTHDQTQDKQIANLMSLLGKNFLRDNNVFRIEHYHFSILILWSPPPPLSCQPWAGLTKIYLLLYCKCRHECPPLSNAYNTTHFLSDKEWRHLHTVLIGDTFSQWKPNLTPLQFLTLDFLY
jgi:hypothetical protein